MAPIISARGRVQADEGAQRTHMPLSPQAKLEEAVGLAEAIDLDIAHSEVFALAQPRPATLIGAGKVDELATIVAEKDAELVIVDHQLSPVQQRNLERSFKAKVLDRTGLILEIFGRRARTKEGRLQVDLAHLEYQRGRLVRSWTHLERQRGGGGFMGGPGETQIEADRRLLQERILRIRRELETVRRTRDLHRAKRRKVPFPVVAIVGYTNAGKSTLFNRLTGAAVLAEDMLFATLDPTLRRVRFPHGTVVILSDTVGFISDLPPHLVAAFRATLEEVVEADLVVHLRDISDPDTTAHAADVEQVLASLGVNASDTNRVIEVWNKIDRLSESDRERLLRQEADRTAHVAISAITGEGIDTLMALIEERLSGAVQEASFTLSPGQMGLMDWIYRHGDVTGREDHEDGSITVRILATHAAREEIERKLSNDKRT
ncbi:GTPase HflX [Chelativorans sp. AA-79]|uniref:GTPase HflX n=1 Tax=Chelativorans sp. AA-79 TaxID=3028735 RepID=UPI0023F7429D|nr:GTPase HflX [Chelativorans sp. AA-79]WEX11907.1 GTPase HflX [Chelativorans sp. AA-79]